MIDPAPTSCINRSGTNTEQRRERMLPKAPKKSEHMFGKTRRRGSRFIAYKVGNNNGRWWVHATEVSAAGRAATYPLWNRNGDSDFGTEIEAAALLLEWIVNVSMVASAASPREK